MAEVNANSNPTNIGGGAMDGSSFEIEKPAKAADTESVEEVSKYHWLHALYHSVVAMVGGGILGFPYATSFFGYAGAAIFITFSSVATYYCSIILIDLQELGQGTYSEVADAVMGEGWSRFTVRPAQFLAFFPTAAVMMVIGGTALHEIDTLVDGKETLSMRLWLVIDAIAVLLMSMLPDLDRAWYVSALGALSILVIVLYIIVGTSIAVAQGDSETADFDRPPESSGSNDQLYKTMASFGDFLFGFGFNAILPDIHASLHEKSAENSRKDMKKTLTGAYSFAYPAYMVVAMVGYAAFGYKVQSNIFLSIDEILPKSAMIVIWALLAIKTATEAAVFNQAAFTLTRDVLGLTLDEDHVDHHPKNWKIDYVIRVIWCILAAVVAIFLPYFSDLTSVTAALSITPTSLIFPIIMWNRKHGDTAPKWRIWFHHSFSLTFIVIGVVALVGATGDIVLNIQSGNSS